MDKLNQLSRFVVESRYSDYPPFVVEKAKAAILYGIVIGIGGAPSRAVSKIVAALDLLESVNQSDARRLFDGRFCSVDNSVIANGALMHTRLQEDAHPAGHIGVAVLPAVLAISEKEMKSGADVLASTIVGYETALRIGRDHASDASARGFRTTSIYGVFGAAAATARLMSLNVTETTNALRLAANYASGLREFVNGGTEEYVLHAGTAAQLGVRAAAYAKAGITASRETLHGPAGFYRAFSSTEKQYDQRLVDELGKKYEFMNVAMKPYPVCQFHRGIIRGVIELRKKIDDLTLKKLQIHMHPFEAEFFGVQYKGPFEAFPQTIMSASFCAGLAWIAGEVSYEGMNRFHDPGINGLLDRIHVVPNIDCQRYQPKLYLTLADGQTLHWREETPQDAYDLNWESALEMVQVISREMKIPEHAFKMLVDNIKLLDDAKDPSSLIDLACELVGLVHCQTSS